MAQKPIFWQKCKTLIISIGSGGARTVMLTYQDAHAHARAHARKTPPNQYNIREKEYLCSTPNERPIGERWTAGAN